MKFAEMLAAMLAGETLPEDWGSQITEAYEYDMSVPGAKVTELEAALAAKDAEITALKVHNYELLMSDAGSADNIDGDADDTVDTDDEEITTDDLFGDPDEEN